MVSLIIDRFKNKKAWVLSQAFLLCFMACNSEPDKPLTAEQKLYKKGKASYMANCTACHNMNPKLPGSVGPDVYGSSKELLHARIMTATYPPGYKPKRTTEMMVELPELEADIPALHHYLNN